MVATVPVTNDLGENPGGRTIYLTFNNSGISTDVELETIHSPTKDESGENEAVEEEAIRIVTRSSSRAPGPPPDGGTSAWLQVLFGHLVAMNSWGFINSFGVFQAYYVTALSRSNADISWIGSIQVFLIFFVGIFSGRLSDGGYFRHVFIAGAITACAGTFLTSISTTYWQIFLVQGVCCGLGYGWMFCPMLSVISTYFSKKKSLATGIVAAGSATGGVIFPLMVQQLLPSIGFAWTIRSMAFIQLGCLAICSVGLKSRVPPRRTGPLVDVESLKDLPYVFFGIAMFFTFLGVYIPFYYIAPFARSIIGLPYTESLNLLVVLNAVGVAGRVVPNYLADRFFGALNTMVVLISALMAYSWTAVMTHEGLYAWAVVYGLSGSCVQGLLAGALGPLTPDVSKAGMRMGQVFTILSFGALIGPPISGLLIQARGGGYLLAQIFSGSALVVGGGFHIAAKMALRARPVPNKV